MSIDYREATTELRFYVLMLTVPPVYNSTKEIEQVVTGLCKRWFRHIPLVGQLEGGNHPFLIASNLSGEEICLRLKESFRRSSYTLIEVPRPIKAWGDTVAAKFIQHEVCSDDD